MSGMNNGNNSDTAGNNTIARRPPHNSRQTSRFDTSSFDQYGSEVNRSSTRRRFTRGRGRGKDTRPRAPPGVFSAITDAPTQSQTFGRADSLTSANPLSASPELRQERGSAFNRPYKHTQTRLRRSFGLRKEEEEVRTPGLDSPKASSNPFSPQLKAKSLRVASAAGPPKGPRGWIHDGPGRPPNNPLVSFATSPQPPTRAKGRRNWKLNTQLGRFEKGSQSAEADAFYTKLEEFRRTFAQHFGLTTPLPACDRSGKSTQDLLKAINETSRPYLEFSQLWPIFHQTQEAHGLTGFVPYTQLAQLIEPIAIAVQAVKTKLRQEQRNGASQVDGQWQQLDQPPVTEAPVVRQIGFDEDLKDPVSYRTAREQQGVQTQPLPAMSSHMRTIDQFLIDVRGLLKQRNASALAEYLIIEPPLPGPYQILINELKQHFPEGAESTLEYKCEAQLKLNGDEEQWPAFSRFLGHYFSFMRDLDPNDLLSTFMGLNALLQSCNTAFGHPTHGIVLVPTILAYSRILARLAIGLEKRPDLVYVAAASADEGEGITLPERAANTIREALITCIRDRSQGPEGKWLATIKLANVCLKILFQSGRVDRTTLIFQNMNTINQSHPLSHFHRADRVTFLYYAGKASFIVGQYYNTAKVLEKAYLECHTQSINQRRLIVIPLVVSNVLHGRFPSEHIYQRDEAAGLRENIGPICRAIKLGDVESFRRLTSFSSPSGQWLLRHKVLLQIREGCEMLVWRSLLRRIFLLAGSPAKQSNQGKVIAGSLELRLVLHVARHLEKRALSPERVGDGGPGNRNLNWIFMDDADAIPAALKKQLVAAEFEGLTDPATGRDLYHSPPPSLLDNRLPDIDTIEATVATLIDQGFLNGYVHRATRKFALQGGRGQAGGIPNQSEAAVAAFPNVWQVVKKANTSKGITNGVAGPGQVIRMTGARPAGM